MSDTDLLRKVEQVINGFGAELTAQKVILQHLLALLLSATPLLAEETLEQLRTDVKAALKRPPRLSSQNEDKRVVALQVQHGDRFFRELEAAVAVMRNRGGRQSH
jgi:hypothetical protein